MIFFSFMLSTSLSNRLQTLISVPSPWSLRWDPLHLPSLRSFDNNNASSWQRSLRVPAEKTGTTGCKWEAMNSLVEARYSSQINWKEDFFKEDTLKAIGEATKESKEQSKEEVLMDEKVPESFRVNIARAAGKRRRETRARVDKDCSIFRKDNDLVSSAKDRDSGCYSGSGTGSSEEETLEEHRQDWNKESERRADGIQGCSASARNTLMDFWSGGQGDEKGWEASCSSNYSPASSLRTGGNFLPPRSLHVRRSRARRREMGRELSGSSHWRGGPGVGHDSERYQRERKSYSSSEVTTGSSSGMIR